MTNPFESPDPETPPQTIFQIGTGVLRTVTPFVTVYIVAWLTDNNIAADSTQVNAAVVTIGGSLWYSVVRILEQRWPKAGWLIGSPKAPVYK